MEARRCTATSKQSGERCKRRPSPGHEVCVMHGSRGGRPPIHGRYSRVLKRLRKRFEEAMEDEALLDLRPALVALDLRIEDLLELADGGDTSVWDELAGLLDQRARRTEQACALHLKAKDSFRQDAIALIARMSDIIIGDLGRQGATPILLRFERELVAPLEEIAAPRPEEGDG